MEHPRELGRVLDRTVLGAELDDRRGLLRSDAGELEEFQGIGEVDPDLHCH